MTRDQYIIRRKMNIVKLGQTLNNVSEACRKLGISRQHYYDIRKAIEEEGLEGLLEKSRRAPRYGNRVAIEIEEKILEYSLQYPTHGQVRAANELKKSGIQISAGGVRSIWMRHNLQVKSLRLKRLEQWAAENTEVLTESQVKALEDAKEEREVHGEVESPHPGFLAAQDTFYVGTIKGVGRIYQQTAIDTHANVGFAKVFTEKTALCAADLLNDRVLPHYDEYNIRVLRILTDNGREYCGLKDSHAYELFLHLNDIEHTRTRVRRPQTNGSVERLNQIIKDEFYEVAFRKKLYRSLEEIQVDLDEFMKEYNEERTNQGKYCQGRTPMQTFLDGLDLYQRFVYEETVAEESVA
jgi:transposase InsO family protein